MQVPPPRRQEVAPPRRPSSTYVQIIDASPEDAIEYPGVNPPEELLEPVMEQSDEDSEDRDSEARDSEDRDNEIIEYMESICKI